MAIDRDRPETAPLGFGAGSRVSGSCVPPGSKSLAQRALLAAALARGRTRIEGLSAPASTRDGATSDPAASDAATSDVDAAQGLLAALGVVGERRGPTGLELAGLGGPGGPELVAGAPLDVGESGTLARLATALVALAGRPGERWTIRAAGSLLFRRSPPLFASLRAAGVEFTRQNLPGTWPVELVSAAPPATLELVAPVSSQEVSALLLALAALPGEHTLLVRGPIPSEPYLAMTLDMLGAFGVEVTSTGTDPERRFRLHGPLRAPGAPLVLEPDASSAAVVLAAACLSGGEMRVPGLGRASSQGDVRIVEHLAAFGCEARFEAAGLAARGFPTRGAALDLTGQPDLAPVLAAVGAGAALRHDATTTLGGLGTLPGKESDRLAGLARGLTALGCLVEVGSDTLRIAPGGTRATADDALVLDPRGDHRMAFAFALFGLLVPGVRVRDPDCVAKSWSSFWREFERLGAVLVRA